MKTLSFREILFLILIGILIAAGGYFVYKTVSGNKQRIALQREINAYRAAKPDTVIKYDSIIIPGKTVIRPVPVRVEIHDSIFVPEKFTWYDSIYHQGKIKFRWMAQIRGSIDYLEFSDFTFPEKIVTITKHFDTCINQPIPKQPFFRIGPYVGMTLNSFNEFPGVELGGQVVIKDQLTVDAGGLYVDNNLYANVRLGWLFKK